MIISNFSIADIFVLCWWLLHEQTNSVILSKWMLETLKYWNVESLKSSVTEMLKWNIKIIKYWNVEICISWNIEMFFGCPWHRYLYFNHFKNIFNDITFFFLHLINPSYHYLLSLSSFFLTIIISLLSSPHQISIPYHQLHCFI